VRCRENRCGSEGYRGADAMAATSAMDLLFPAGDTDVQPMAKSALSDNQK